MNEAKIHPWKSSALEVDSRAGVHMNTKIYMAPEFEKQLMNGVPKRCQDQRTTVYTFEEGLNDTQQHDLAI